MEKSTTTIYKIVAVVLFATIIIYLHDFIPKGYGKVGRSSLRVYLFTVSAELRALIWLFFVWFLAKGKAWRFTLILPILLTTYQLIIRLSPNKNVVWNQADYKLYLTLLISAGLIIYYFKKRKEIGE